MNTLKKQILLTNDDGIESPGLWAAARVLSSIGFVSVVAPRDRCSGMSRSFGRNEDGKIEKREIIVNDQEWTAYAVGATPALSVLHAVLEVMPQKPDLVVSGINYGENISTDITSSGTVGAALEAASLGIPALATSFQVNEGEWDSYMDIDFSVASHFTCFFAEQLLEKEMPADVDLLNLVVPQSATKSTPWQITRIAPGRYFSPYVKRKGSLDQEGQIDTHITVHDDIPKDSDVYVLRKKNFVSVTPISLDLTSRVDFTILDKQLRG